MTKSCRNAHVRNILFGKLFGARAAFAVECERVLQERAVASCVVHVDERVEARGLFRAARAHPTLRREARRLAQDAREQQAVSLFGRAVGRAYELRITRRLLARGESEHLR